MKRQRPCCWSESVGERAAGTVQIPVATKAASGARCAGVQAVMTKTQQPKNSVQVVQMVGR